MEVSCSTCPFSFLNNPSYKKMCQQYVIVEGRWLVSWIQFEEFEELLAWMRVSLSCFKSVSSYKSDSLSAHLLKLAQNRPECHWDPLFCGHTFPYVRKNTVLKVSELLSCYWKMKLVLLLVLVSYSQHWSGGLHCFTVTNNSWLWVTVCLVLMAPAITFQLVKTLWCLSHVVL